MNRIIWTIQAIEDAEAVREFIARDSPRYAQAEVERIVAADILAQRHQAFAGLVERRRMNRARLLVKNLQRRQRSHGGDDLVGGDAEF